MCSRDTAVPRQAFGVVVAGAPSAAILAAPLFGHRLECRCSILGRDPLLCAAIARTMDPLFDQVASAVAVGPCGLQRDGGVLATCEPVFPPSNAIAPALGRSGMDRGTNRSHPGACSQRYEAPRCESWRRSNARQAASIWLRVSCWIAPRIPAFFPAAVGLHRTRADTSLLSFKDILERVGFLWMPSEANVNVDHQ